AQNAIITVEAIKNNDTLRSQSIIRLPYETRSLMESIAPMPDDSFAVSAEGLEHYFGIWRGCNNVCIQRPIILVEGFDPTDSRYLHVNSTLYCENKCSKLKDMNLYDVLNVEGMADMMRDAGFDIIILNYADGKASITSKANVVEELIRVLKDSLTNCGSSQEFIILAPSEAALVVRYALAEMEGNGEEHNTKMFISYDGPHQGGNLPLSLQYLVDFMITSIPLNWLFNFGSEIMEVINAVPTRQMIVYHYNSYPSPDPEFTSFFSSLNSLNGGIGYPTKCRNIAIANGSGNSYDQGFIDLDKIFSFNIIVGVANYFVDGWAVPDGGTDEKIFSGIAYYPLAPIPFYIALATIKVGGTKPYDNCPGGKNDFIYCIEDTLEIVLGDLFFSNSVDEYHNFIPTISAIDLKSSDDLFYNIYNNITGPDGFAFKYTDYGPDVSPFDAIFVSDVNKRHVICGTSEAIIQFINDEIMPENMFLQNQSVTVPTDFEAAVSVTAGANVTDRYLQGDFVVENSSGTVNISAGEIVSLKPGTHIRPTSGGTARIFIDENISCNNTKSLSNYIPNEYFNNKIIEKKYNNSFYNDKNKISETKIYPNPFDDYTNIKYYLTQNTMINITISDIFGQQIEIIENRNMEKGLHSIILDGRKFSPGIYLCTIKENSVIVSKHKIIIIK
ncbi:MAG: T9SS type A sorting domain-containing protein, partial [Bacteroidia bacterium]|nr:T9SS type A sorting domain-containing protein [Bacteroidia bacterium]